MTECQMSHSYNSFVTSDIFSSLFFSLLLLIIIDFVDVSVEDR